MSNWNFLLHSTVFHITIFKNILEDYSLLPAYDSLIDWYQQIDDDFSFNLLYKENKISKNNIKLNCIIKNRIKYKDYFDNLYKNKDIVKDIFKKIEYIPAVYTQYIFKNLNNKKDWLYQGVKHSIVFVINNKILKDKPFIACNSVSYGSCFFDKLKNDFYGEGNLKEIPRLNKFENKINKDILNKTDYIFSNEVLFDEIPLNYIKAILCNRKQYKEVIKLLKEYNIDIPVIKIRVNNPNYEEILSKIN